MKTLITPADLAGTDLGAYNEIWLTPSSELPQQGPSDDQLCLWRANELFTHDMLSEGTHGQNVTRVWLIAENIDDDAAVLQIEEAVRARLTELNLDGEFYPAERSDTRSDEVS
jgi:hypothetical protein